MTNFQIRQQNRMVNALAFLRKYEGDWVAGSRPAQGLASLPQTIAGLTQTGAEQGGGERQRKGGTASKSALYSEILADMKDISRTATLVGRDEDDPDFGPKFGMPASRAEERMIAAGTDFSRLLADDATWAKFTAEGMRADLRAELSADLAAYPTARDEQAEGRLDQSGATGDLGELTHRGQMTVDGLDVYFRNLYAKNPTRLDEWKTASRLERAAKRQLNP